MESYIQQTLISGQFSFTLPFLVFATGLLTSATPCVYPMLPISVSIVGRYHHGRLQAFGYSLLYALGVAVVYAGLGMLAALSGQMFGSVASHPASLALVAVVCLCLGLWMLGWLRLPQWAPAVNLTLMEGYPRFSVFSVGALSGLVMAPCTSPVLGLLLLMVASQQEVVLGGLLMFIFAFGMCALLILAGTFSGLLSLLPGSGPWMNRIKVALALPMIFAALYFFNESIQLF